MCIRDSYHHVLAVLCRRYLSVLPISSLSPDKAPIFMSEDAIQQLAIYYENLIQHLSIQTRPPSQQHTTREDCEAAHDQDAVDGWITEHGSCLADIHGDVQIPDSIQRKTVYDPAVGSDHSRNAVVCGTHQRQAEFDGAQLRLTKMLVGAGRVPEPGVVGDIENEISSGGSACQLDVYKRQGYFEALR